MSTHARLFCGLSLVIVPTIVFGGTTLLSVVSRGAYGTPGPPNLTPDHVTYYRAGHAHAGVLLILSLFIQLALDNVAGTVWTTRIIAAASPVLVSAGFFGVAHLPALRVLLYLGAASVAWATLITGIGLLRSL